MKKFIIIVGILCLTISLFAKNFFEELGDIIKETKKDNQQNTQPVQQTEKKNVQQQTKNANSQINLDNQPAQNEENSLIKLGRKFGLNDKTVKIIESSAGVIKSNQEISPEEEKSIGGSLAIEVVNRYNFEYENDVINEYVNLVGQTIVKFCDKTDVEYHFLVLNSNEINAFAAPGGYVFITKGLFKLLENESQLAGVLGHEIAHISQAHILKTLQRGKFLENLTKLSATIANKDVSKYNKIMEQVNKTLFEQGVDKSMEYEADKYGVEFAVRAGYNANGLYEFLLNLQKRIGKSKSIFFSTHPPVESRLSKLENEVLINYDKRVGAVLADRFNICIKIF